MYTCYPLKRISQEFTNVGIFYYIAHETLVNVMWQPGWEGDLGRIDTCICMAVATYGKGQFSGLEKVRSATGLQKVSFDSSSKERQCQKMFKLLQDCTHLTH